MKKQSFLILAAALTASAALQAQIPVVKGRKWDIATGQFAQRAAQPRLGPSSTGAEAALQGVIISATDAEAVADSIASAGYRATVITPTYLTATIPPSLVERLGAIEAVSYISAAEQVRPLMTAARATTYADAVHAGTELETPFTGKDVVIGVIDKGFQFDHIAFKDADGNSRVVAVWNRYAGTNPTTSIPSGSDGMSGYGGHATHVTGIAAGSRIAGNSFYGMAPEADIIMIPSNFGTDEIVEDAAYIKRVAESMGKPWVINMSFGHQYGPHDGSTNYDQAMSALCGKGGLMTASMGNEGQQKIHASHTFTADGEVVNLLLTTTEDFNYMDLWEQTADGEQHLSVRPFVYNPTTRSKDYRDDAFWQAVAYFGAEINPNNNKEHYELQVNLSTFKTNVGLLTGTPLFGVEVTGQAGSTLHCWTNGYGEFTRGVIAGASEVFVAGDSQYLVGGAAGTIPHAISVGSFNSSATHVALKDGTTYSWGVGETGDLSNFSSNGPFLGDEPKPTVAGPGAMVSSAWSYYDGFDISSVSLTSAVDRNGAAASYSTARLMPMRHHFYGVMAGTSMSSPAVAGILALWLEANPELDYADVKEILRTTSTKDSYTGSEEWNARFGYGKINAYEGLKAALKLAESTGIGDALNTPEPLTLLRGDGAWRLLFNTSETFAAVRVYDLSGSLVMQRSLQGVRRGDEVELSFAGLPKGVYMINIATTASTSTRKVMVP